jgi:hypothetical protein
LHGQDQARTAARATDIKRSVQAMAIAESKSLMQGISGCGRL